MKIKYKFLGGILISLCVLPFLSCKKSFLDKKPDQSLLVPTTLQDFQAILDDNIDMNAAPYLNMVATDDIITTDEGLNGADYLIKNSYLWAKDIYAGQTDYNWNVPYLQVFYANIVLEGLQKYQPSPSEQIRWNQIKGAALFYRSFAFYNIAQQFAAPYVPATANKDAGIPIRLTADVNVKSVRGTLAQSYAQIVADFAAASELLPDQVAFATQPTRAAALGMLARTYQTMQQYDHSAAAATACLAIRPDLMDYNTFNPSVTRPFPRVLPTNLNPEILFYTPLISNASFLISPSLTFIDPQLYQSYANEDLRKVLFFRTSGDNVIYKGNYSNGANVFAGIATDEVYLIRAEARIRTGQMSDGLSDLNKLLKSRYKTGSFTAISAATRREALKIVLRERRKELVYRNLLRWTDLKRLNQEDDLKITITRTSGGKTYSLTPGDPRYAFPIPDDEIARSGMTQNPR